MWKLILLLFVPVIYLRVAVAQDRPISVAEGTEYRSVATLSSPDSKITAHLFGSFGYQSTKFPGYIELRDAQAQPLHTLKHSLGRIKSISFSPDGNLIASAAGTGGWRVRSEGDEPWPDILGELCIWNTATGHLKLKITEPQAQMRAVAFSPDGKTLAVGSGDGKIRLLDVSTSKVKRIISTGAYVSSLDFSPDGRKLVSTLWDRKVRVWNIATGKIWRVFESKQSQIFKAAFSPDGKIIASSGIDPLRWWNVKTGKLIKTFTETVEQRASLTFPSDAKKAVISMEIPR